MSTRTDRYPPIGAYGLLADGAGATLVSADGSIDWCCLPRIDSGSCFGRLLGWENGGHCAFAPTAQAQRARAYEEDTLVLCTGHRSVTDLADTLDALSLDVRIIGDAASPRTAEEAVFEGLRVATEI